MNGECLVLSARAMQSAARLADQRMLPPAAARDTAWIDALYDWYCSGYILLR
jgi:hypothetical protein